MQRIEAGRQRCCDEVAELDKVLRIRKPVVVRVHESRWHHATEQQEGCSKDNRWDQRVAVDAAPEQSENAQEG